MTPVFPNWVILQGLAGLILGYISGRFAFNLTDDSLVLFTFLAYVGVTLDSKLYYLRKTQLERLS